MQRPTYGFALPPTRGSSGRMRPLPMAPVGWLVGAFAPAAVNRRIACAYAAGNQLLR